MMSEALDTGHFGSEGGEEIASHGTMEGDEECGSDDVGVMAVCMTPPTHIITPPTLAPRYATPESPTTHNDKGMTSTPTLPPQHHTKETPTIPNPTHTEEDPQNTPISPNLPLHITPIPTDPYSTHNNKGLESTPTLPPQHVTKETPTIPNLTHTVEEDPLLTPTSPTLHPQHIIKETPTIHNPIHTVEEDPQNTPTSPNLPLQITPIPTVPYFTHNNKGLESTPTLPLQHHAKETPTIPNSTHTVEEDPLFTPTSPTLPTQHIIKETPTIHNPTHTVEDPLLTPTSPTSRLPQHTKDPQATPTIPRIAHTIKGLENAHSLPPQIIPTRTPTIPPIIHTLEDPTIPPTISNTLPQCNAEENSTPPHTTHNIEDSESTTPILLPQNINTENTTIPQTTNPNLTTCIAHNVDELNNDPTFINPTPNNTQDATSPTPTLTLAPHISHSQEEPSIPTTISHTNTPTNPNLSPHITHSKEDPTIHPTNPNLLQHIIHNKENHTTHPINPNFVPHIPHSNENPNDSPNTPMLPPHKTPTTENPKIPPTLPPHTHNTELPQSAIKDPISTLTTPTLPPQNSEDPGTIPTLLSHTHNTIIPTISPTVLPQITINNPIKCSPTQIPLLHHNIEEKPTHLPSSDPHNTQPRDDSTSSPTNLTLHPTSNHNLDHPTISPINHTSTIETTPTSSPGSGLPTTHHIAGNPTISPTNPTSLFNANHTPQNPTNIPINQTDSSGDSTNSTTNSTLLPNTNHIPEYPTFTNLTDTIEITINPSKLVPPTNHTTENPTNTQTNSTILPDNNHYPENTTIPPTNPSFHPNTTPSPEDPPEDATGKQFTGEAEQAPGDDEWLECSHEDFPFCRCLEQLAQGSEPRAIKTAKPQEESPECLEGSGYSPPRKTSPETQEHPRSFEDFVYALERKRSPDPNEFSGRLNDSGYQNIHMPQEFHRVSDTSGHIPHRKKMQELHKCLKDSEGPRYIPHPRPSRGERLWQRGYISSSLTACRDSNLGIFDETEESDFLDSEPELDEHEETALEGAVGGSLGGGGEMLSASLGLLVPRRASILSCDSRRESIEVAPDPVKVAVFGTDGVGKSALIVRLLTGRFIGEYDPTMEAVYSYQFPIPEHSLPLQVMDTAGHVDVSSEGRERQVSWGEGFMLVFSLTSHASFAALSHLRRVILELTPGSPRPIVLVGNKADLVHAREVQDCEIRDLADTWGSEYYEVAAPEPWQVVVRPFEAIYLAVIEARAAP